MDVDHVIQRRCPCRFLPHIARKHFAGYNSAMISRQVLKQIELAGGELDAMFFPNDGSSHGIDFQIANLECALGFRLVPSKQSPNASSEFREGKRLDQIIVGSRIE